MRKSNDPAFPVSSTAEHEYCGMTMRDYFAAKAMAAIISGNNADECSLGIGAAKDAYAVADAMLAAREVVQ